MKIFDRLGYVVADFERFNYRQKNSSHRPQINPSKADSVAKCRVNPLQCFLAWRIAYLDF